MVHDNWPVRTKSDSEKKQEKYESHERENDWPFLSAIIWFREVIIVSTLTRTYFSESPRHLLTRELAVMLKNVKSHSVATDFASIVLPYRNTFYHDLVNIFEKLIRTDFADDSQGHFISLSSLWLTFTCAWWAIKKYSLPGCKQFREQFRIFRWKNNCLFEQFFTVVQAMDVVPMNVQICHHNFLQKQTILIFPSFTR